MEDDDGVEVIQALEKLEKEWEASWASAKSKVDAVTLCESSQDARSLPRLNALAQDSLTTLRSILQNLEIYIPQHPSDDAAEYYNQMLQQWKDQLEMLRLGLRKANLHAKANMEKSAKENRQLLLSGGKEGTLRRRNLQTKAGLSAASESATESLRRTVQVMSEELDRSTGTLGTLNQSNTTLRRAELEYVGQNSLLKTSKKLLSSLRGSDLLDRLIIILGALFFVAVCLFILHKRIIGRGKPVPLLPFTNNVPSIPFKNTTNSVPLTNSSLSYNEEL